ncbi:MAG: hypothetical protein ABSF71_13510 [Terriglobia bacterium]
MKHSKYARFLAMVLSVFAATAGLPLRAANSDWNNLNILKPGQLIRVELKDAKSYDGELQGLNDEGITLRLTPSPRTFARKDILRVYSKNESHRARNFLIGAGIGAILAAIGVSANHWGENVGLRSTAWEWPVGLGVFGGIGAAIPTGGWREVYRAPRHRGSANSGH